jgi:hypothetical protein
LAFSFILVAKVANRGARVGFACRHGQFLGVLEQVLPPPPVAAPASLVRFGCGTLQFVGVSHHPDGPDERLATLLVILVPRPPLQLGLV